MGGGASAENRRPERTFSLGHMCIMGVGGGGAWRITCALSPSVRVSDTEIYLAAVGRKGQ